MDAQLKEAETQRDRAVQRELDLEIELGRLLLVEEKQPVDGLLWLTDAYERGSQSPVLPFLLAEAGRATGPLSFTLKGHSDHIFSASFSPDGQRILTASDDKTARIWEADTGKPLGTLVGHSGTFFSASFSPDGRRILTADTDRARVFDAGTGRLLLILERYAESERLKEQGLADEVVEASYSPDGRRILTANADSKARVFDADTGKLLATCLTPERHGVYSASFSPDGRRILVSGSVEWWVFDAGTGKLLVTLRSGTLIRRLKGEFPHVGDYYVFDAGFSPDGTLIVAANADSKALLFDADAGKPLVILEGHSDRIQIVRFSPDGQNILTTSDNNTVRLWRAYDGTLLVTLKAAGELFPHATFSPDGQRILINNGKKAQVFDADNGKLLAACEGHSDWIRDATYSPDGLRILTASDDKTARVFTVGTGKRLVTLEGDGLVESASYSRDGRLILTTHRRAAQIFDAGTGKRLATLAAEDSVESASFSRDGRFVLTTHRRAAQIFDAGTGKPLATLAGHSGALLSASFSLDGRRILTASDDKTAQIWDAETAKLLFTLAGHSGALFRGASFSPDGKFVLVASSNKVQIWDAKTGKLLSALEDRERSFDSASFSPNGRFILIVSGTLVQIYDMGTGKLLFTLKEHSGQVQDVSYSPDGRFILTTASRDPRAQIWDAETGKLLSMLEESGSVGINSASFSPDGRFILMAVSGAPYRIDRALIFDATQERRAPEELRKVIDCLLGWKLFRGVTVPTVADEKQCARMAEQGVALQVKLDDLANRKTKLSIGITKVEFAEDAVKRSM